MWFKIEVNKDGSVANCVEVEGSMSNAKRVYYIEADSRAEALNLALRRYQAYLQANRERMYNVRAKRRAAGECRDCGRACGAERRRCVDCEKHAYELRSGKKPAGKPGNRKRHNRIVRHTILLEVQKKFEALSPTGFRVWLRSEIDKAEPNRQAAT